MTRIVKGNGVWGLHSGIGISRLRLSRQIGRIYAVVADTNKLYAMLIMGGENDRQIFRQSIN